MFNLFKSKKDPGKAATKPSKKAQAVSTRAGARTTSTETKSWFAKSSRPARRDGQIKSISLSSPSLNNNNESKKSNKRPLTIVGSSNVTVRRGQQTSKIEGQDDLSRSSSITNLNAERGKGAKPKKAESRDKLDKIEKKHEKNRTSLTKNNNKEAEVSADSFTDVEALQKQLAQMANDKSTLALQLGEQTGQLNALQHEFVRLKMLQEESAQKLEQLGEENTILRNRLRDVAHSPLSDSEKQQLLYESHRHSSAPASIATNLLDDGGDITACPTPEWDKHSSSNVSEVSVACLQDKINQMQETHYSTNEELQATLQELTDLQRQLTELQQENMRLNDEKNLMFESLCRQTERLNDSRNEVESLKQLLYKDESGQFETAAEREQKLVDLLKSAQEEREVLLMKQEQLGNDLEDSRSTNLMHNDEISQLTERVKTLESTLDAKHAEHKLLDQELAQAKDQSSGRQIEINRLKDLLENARTKINELEQDRALSDKSELDELLDNARKEKDALESEVAHLKEQLALSKNETEKLREQVSILQEECKVIRNNAKTTQSDLEYKLEKLLVEKTTLGEQLQQFQEAVNELQVQAQCQLDDKRQLSAVLSETQRNLNESERKIVDLENELSELKRTKQEQEEEWEKFQNDLLTSVRVANDFKTEAQQDLQKLIMENKAGRERIKQLEAQIDKLKGGRRKSPNKRLTTEESLMASLQRRYKEIEDLPEEQLTDEQKAIKVLKTCYEGTPKQKPFAKKSKDKLAISKPSLDSVISNPKLGKIFNDPKLQNVEAFEFFSDDEGAKNRLSLMSKVHSDSALPVNRDREEMARSKSLSDIYKEVVSEEPTLRRYESTEHLPSLSNQKNKRSTVNLYTLEEICRNIDPNTPEDQLTKEQRFALRLREVLLKEEKKTTLKKHPKLGRKKIVISRPTEASVAQNEKLWHIIRDPVIQTVPVEPTRVSKRGRSKPVKRDKDRYSMPATMAQISSKPPNKSKSYNDISFSFDKTINMYSEPEEGKILDQVHEVLPPEEFRDPSPPPVRQDAVLTTFQPDTDTMKKEHNYLEDDLDLEYIDEDADEQKTDQEVDSVDTTDFKDEHDFSDVLNDTLLRRLDHEDDLLYHLDEEDIRARRDSRKRFSRVVEEIKGKFESTDEEDEKEAIEDVIDEKWETVESFTRIENSDWEAVEVIEDSHLTKTRRFEESAINEDELKKMDDVAEKETVLKKEMELLTSEDKIISIESNVENLKIAEISPVYFKHEFNDFERKEEMLEDFEQDWSNESTGFLKKLPEESSHIKMEDLITDMPKNGDYEDSKREGSNDLLQKSPKPLADIDKEDLFMIKEQGKDLKQKLDLPDGASEDSSEERDHGSTILTNKDSKEVSKSEKEVEENVTELLSKEEMELYEKICKEGPSRPLSDINPEDLMLVDTLKEQYLHEDKEDASGSSKDVTEFLTKEEVKLLGQIPKGRVSRPLSDINPEDLMLVDKLKEKYLCEDDEVVEPSEDVSELLTKEEMEILEKIPKSRTSRPLSDINSEDLLLLDKLKEEYLREEFEDENQTPKEQKLSESLQSISDTEQLGKDQKEVQNVKLKEQESVSTDLLTKEEMEFLPKNTEEREDLLLADEYLDKDQEELSTVKLNEDIEELKMDESKDLWTKEESEEQYIREDQLSNDLLTEEEMAFLQKITGNTEHLFLVEKPEEEYLPGHLSKTDKSKDLLTAEEVEFLQKNSDDTENLLLVDEPEEYLGGHLSEIDRSKDLLTEEEMEFLQKDMKDTEDEADGSKGLLGKEETKPIEDSFSDIKPKADTPKPSDIITDDLMVLENFKTQYLKEDEGKKDEERHKFPRILSPTKLTEPTSYEPVYANFQVTSGRSDYIPPPIFGKKPLALPRSSTVDSPTSDEPIYRDFGGQVRKTRFSISYERKKNDTYKETNQEKKTRVKDLREVFERKSRSDFSSIVSKALEDEDN